MLNFLVPLDKLEIYAMLRRLGLRTSEVISNRTPARTQMLMLELCKLARLGYSQKILRAIEHQYLGDILWQLRQERDWREHIAKQSGPYRAAYQRAEWLLTRDSIIREAGLGGFFAL